MFPGFSEMYTTIPLGCLKCTLLLAAECICWNFVFQGFFLKLFRVVMVGLEITLSADYSGAVCQSFEKGFQRRSRLSS